MAYVSLEKTSAKQTRMLCSILLTFEVPNFVVFIPGSEIHRLFAVGLGVSQ